MNIPPSATAEAAAIVRPATKFCVALSADSQLTVVTNGFLNDEFRADSIIEANILNSIAYLNLLDHRRIENEKNQWKFWTIIVYFTHFAKLKNTILVFNDFGPMTLQLFRI